MQRQLKGLLLLPLCDGLPQRRLITVNWGREGLREKKLDKAALELERNVYCTFRFALPWIHPEYLKFFSHSCSFSREWSWSVGRYSMAISSVKSNGNRVQKGNEFTFLLLCFVLQTSSMFISYYLVIFTKKNMRPLNSTFSFIST